MFDSNSAFLYVIVAVVITFVLAESAYFLAKAVKRSKQIGMDKNIVKRVIKSSALFTIAPAVAILLGVIVLSNALGFPLPWLRLSVIGALTYETTAAATAASALGASLSNLITDPKTYSAIAWVMTLGILPSVIFVTFMGKKIENGVMKIKSKDEKWGEIFQSSLFLGMISAFLGVIFATIGEGLVGWIPVFVMISSAIIMLVCGMIVKKFKINWMKDYALPISMIGAMALALPITNLVKMIAGV